MDTLRHFSSFRQPRKIVRGLHTLRRFRGIVIARLAPGIDENFEKRFIGSGARFLFRPPQVRVAQHASVLVFRLRVGITAGDEIAEVEAELLDR